MDAPTTLPSVDVAIEDTWFNANNAWRIAYDCMSFAVYGCSHAFGLIVLKLLSSPAGPAAKRFLVNFKLKIAHPVAIVLRMP